MRQIRFTIHLIRIHEQDDNSKYAINILNMYNVLYTGLVERRVEGTSGSVP